MKKDVIGQVLEGTNVVNGVVYDVKKTTKTTKESVVTMNKLFDGIKKGLVATGKMGEVKVTAVVEEMVAGELMQFVTVVPKTGGAFADEETEKKVLAYTLEFKSKTVKVRGAADEANAEVAANKENKTNKNEESAEMTKKATMSAEELMKEVLGKNAVETKTNNNAEGTTMTTTNTMDVMAMIEQLKVRNAAATTGAVTTPVTGDAPAKTAAEIVADIAAGGSLIDVKTNGVTEVITKEVKDKTPAFKLNLPGAAPRINLEGGAWYNDATDPELAEVTSESRNEAVGIVSLKIRAGIASVPSMICKVDVRLTDGTLLRGVTAFNSKKGEGFYITEPSYKGSNNKYYSHFKLEKAAKAQIMRYLEVNNFKAPAGNAKWYLEEREEMPRVQYNLPAENIELKGANENQQKMGMVAKATITLPGATIYGISVFASTKGDDSMFLSAPSDSYVKDGKKTYWEHALLSMNTKGAILRYVDSLIEQQ